MKAPARPQETQMVNRNGKGYVYALYHSTLNKTVVKIGHCIGKLPSERLSDYNARYGTVFDCYRYWVVPPNRKIAEVYEQKLQGKFDRFDRREIYLADIATVASEADALFESDFPELNKGIRKRPIIGTRQSQKKFG